MGGLELASARCREQLIGRGRQEGDALQSIAFGDPVPPGAERNEIVGSWDVGAASCRSTPSLATAIVRPPTMISPTGISSVTRIRMPCGN